MSTISLINIIYEWSKKIIYFFRIQTLPQVILIGLPYAPLTIYETYFLTNALSNEIQIEISLSSKNDTIELPWNK